MHFVLCTFQRDTSQYGSSLNALSRTAGAMSGNKTFSENIVERMLTAGEGLRGIVVLVVDVQIVVLHGIAALR